MKKIIICILSVTILFSLCIIGVFYHRQNHQPGLPLASISNQTIPHDSKIHINEKGKLNINTATVSELTLLPGIGEAIATRIVEYRTENGPFTTVQELLNVKGIGEQKLNDILDKICIR